MSRRTVRNIKKIICDVILDDSFQDKFDQTWQRFLKQGRRKMVNILYSDSSNIDRFIDEVWLHSRDTVVADLMFDILYSELDDCAQIEHWIDFVCNKMIFSQETYYEFHRILSAYIWRSIVIIFRKENIVCGGKYLLAKQGKEFLDGIFSVAKSFFLEEFLKQRFKDILAREVEKEMRGIQTTIAEVFIVESLNRNEDDNKKDGKKLYDLLRLQGKKPKYFYVESRDELEKVLDIFVKSKYRFLHISCHAGNSEVCLTDEQLSYQEFIKLFNNKFHQHRVFFSACELGNELFLTMLGEQNKGQLHSIVAPKNLIHFHHAAIIWNAFYLAIFEKNAEFMSSQDLVEIMQQITKLFPVEFVISIFESIRKNYKMINVPEKENWKFNEGVSNFVYKS